MAHVNHTEVFNCKPEQFYSILVDCEKYPDFLTEMESCKIVKAEGDRKEVEYKVSVVKTFTYRNEHIENAPNELKFRFIDGDLFKSMNGSWKLENDGGKTKAHYQVEASFGMFVPGAMAKKMISANLPGMMKAYHKRVSQLFGA